MDAFENYFAGLRNKSIAVLGLGVSNRPLVRLLLEFGCQVTGCDKTPRDKLDEEVLELEKLGCKLHVGPDYLEGVQAEILFRTPGMHPNNPAIEALRQRGAKVTSEMEVFFEVCPCHLIAVTGSDGKTTTTTLVSEMLKASGKTVWLVLLNHGIVCLRLEMRYSREADKAGRIRLSGASGQPYRGRG